MVKWAGTVLIGQFMALLNISSLTLLKWYQFKLHDKPKISSTSKYSVVPGGPRRDTILIGHKGSGDRQ